MTELDVNSAIRAFFFTPFGAFFYLTNLIMLFRCLENVLKYLSSMTYKCKTLNEVDVSHSLNQLIVIFYVLGWMHGSY